MTLSSFAGHATRRRMMPRVADRHLRLLKPYLLGNKARANGEWDMYCPLHEDTKRSASLNVLTGEWNCFAGCGGGGVIDLIRSRSRWVDPGQASANGAPSPRGAPTEKINMGMIDGWHAHLLDNEALSDYLVTERGIHTKTLADFKIGYDSSRRCYTIPVFGYDKKEIWNVRRYDPFPADERRKIWSVQGMRPTELYPAWMVNEWDELVVGEGEWDVILTIQNGHGAVTRTAAADVWRPEWTARLKGKRLYMGHDADHKGQLANRKIARATHRTSDVRVLKLPFDIVEKHGEDLTDFWLNHDSAEFEVMKAEALPWRGAKTESEAEIVTVLDSFDSNKVSEPVRLQVTIKGRKDPGYSIPYKALLACTRDAGVKCTVCPMNPAGGEARLEIAPTNPLVLALKDSTNLQVHEILRQEYGAQKCSRLTIDVQEYQAVEELFARPSIDHADGTKARDYKNIKITSVGRHDTMPNNTVIVTGALYPSPRGQQNEFLAWNVMEQETSVDRFELTSESVKLMQRFQPRRGQSPLRKLGEIERALAQHVTRIVGRPEMHALMDLTFHSVMSFKFGGQLVNRGWIESLIVGDTRTGKSEAAERYVRHFGAGEVVGGEAATLAGLVGGLQQIGGKDWAVTWGVIPLNDRRVVVIDELSGLHPDEIAKMSDVRASGVARLTKIQQEVTLARTRLLWLGNPRNGGMDQFTYGVDSLRSLVGNPEDIARFDLAMALSIDDVPSKQINRSPSRKGALKYTSEACNRLLMWVWTRQPEQVLWLPEAEDLVYQEATLMGQAYIEDPPIVQAANVRIKIARVAVALAARLFSTDRHCERVIVNPDHVIGAVQFMNHLYSMPSFGYADRSNERIRDIAEALDNADDIKHYLQERRGLAKFLRTVPHFKRMDLEEGMISDKETANEVINKLWEALMIRKEGEWRVGPTLQGLLREVPW